MPHDSPPFIRADFHCHTHHSADSALRPAVLVERAAAAGIDRIAVTDHGEIDGAFEAHALDPARVIVGEEIRCRCRTELIGLYMSERIPQGLPMEEVVERLRAQGAVIYAPHPFAYLIRTAGRARRALDAADAVEVFNSRAFWPAWNAAALRAARERGLPACASTDGHFAWEVGRACTELPWFDDAAGLRAALPFARPVGRAKASPAIHVLSLGLMTGRLALWHTVGGRPSARTARAAAR